MDTKAWFSLGSGYILIALISEGQTIIIVWFETPNVAILKFSAVLFTCQNSFLPSFNIWQVFILCLQ